MTFAQRAFLTYTNAVINNKPVFETVATLNIASLSSRYLQSLRQHDLWAALPNLRTLKLVISPDWRDTLSMSLRERIANVYLRPLKSPESTQNDLAKKYLRWQNSSHGAGVAEASLSGVWAKSPVDDDNIQRKRCKLFTI